MIRLNLGEAIINVDDEETTEDENGIRVYPNPVQDVLRISSTSEIITWSVWDVSGKLIATKPSVRSVSESLDLNSWSEGLYLLTVQTNKGMSVTRFVKK
jgi:hypothetical protein